MSYVYNNEVLTLTLEEAMRELEQVKPEDERHGSDRAGGIYLLRPSWMTREREAS